MSRTLVILLIVGILALGAGYAFRPQVATPIADGAAMVQVALPDLAGPAADGQAAFAVHCAACHGTNADGRDGAGPPLVHKIYEPSHHGDMAFVLAARQGVRAHHWTFGDMAPVDGVSDEEIADIVTFVRTLQRANGIH
jgi:mono/diheme cytochrome c family protein